jgi:murein DD-endopeptidase MepM/ murein hydrolase activator NlpD
MRINFIKLLIVSYRFLSIKLFNCRNINCFRFPLIQLLLTTILFSQHSQAFEQTTLIPTSEQYSSEECNIFEVVRGVNVRNGASKFDEKIGRLLKGQKYPIQHAKGKWTAFQFDDLPRLAYAYTNKYLKPVTGGCFITRSHKHSYVHIWRWDTKHNEPLIVGQVPNGLLLVKNKVVDDFVETFFAGKTRYIKKTDLIDLSIRLPEKEIKLENLDLNIGLYQCTQDAGYIYPSEVTELDCSNRGITSTRGIKYLSELKRLDLSNNLFNSAESISEIQFLTNLEELNLSHNNIKAVNLNANKALKLLSIENTQISELEYAPNQDIEIIIYPQGDLASFEFDNNMVWPLCGRLNADVTGDDICSTNRVGGIFTDWPFAYGFGPRIVPADKNRFDFHRGLDIATPEGTPIYAVTDGIVKISGKHKNFKDNVILIRHNRPGEKSCRPKGCYHSVYLHLSDWVVNAGDKVKKGQLIGYTGTSIAGMWPHLHFEIRNAHPSDPYSFWQRDAINPVNVLPRSNKTMSSLSVKVDALTPNKVSVDYYTYRWDVNRIEVRVYDENDTLLIDHERGNPLNGNYFVNPPFIDFNVYNRTYTHKNSSKFPWEEFGESGNLACPYHHEHADKYSAHVHLDKTKTSSKKIGMFNGMEFIPMARAESDMFNLNVSFNKISNLEKAKCVEVIASSNLSWKNRGYWGDCKFLTDN